MLLSSRRPKRSQSHHTLDNYLRRWSLKRHTWAKLAHSKRCLDPGSCCLTGYPLPAGHQAFSHMRMMSRRKTWKTELIFLSLD